MMMEEEIERTRAEIQGIEEACEKVEEALNRVVNGEEVSGGMDDGEKVEDNLGEDTMEDKLGDDKMEDVQGGDEIPDATTSGEQKWYERKELLDLWNGA
jgi:hypothetical protein